MKCNKTECIHNKNGWQCNNSSIKAMLKSGEYICTKGLVTRKNPKDTEEQEQYDLRIIF